MFSYCNLPLPLLALLFTALPALSGPTTPYDPFHDIAKHAPKPPEQPICCLRPLTPLEETEEEVLLTFEQWKAKRLAEVHRDHVSASHIPQNSGHKPGTMEDMQDPSPSPSEAGYPAVAPLTVADMDIPPERLSPHFQIPLTDRFNYASMDCSARVHDAHKSVKSASSILSSKKDRYMLSPCAEAKQFVVVELCDDIRIDTVQLANFEFFSGVFKDFSVSVAKTYSSGWVSAGTYRGKNTRSVQSFHPPKSLADFYRFIRIDFHSHYGNEYYCPLSLLRVYGLTHLEHWKWDMWEDESRRRAVEAASPEMLDSAIPPQTIPVAVMNDSASTVNSSTDVSPSTNGSSADVPVDLPSNAIQQGVHGEPSPAVATDGHSMNHTQQQSSTVSGVGSSSPDLAVHIEEVHSSSDPSTQPSQNATQAQSIAQVSSASIQPHSTPQENQHNTVHSTTSTTIPSIPASSIPSTNNSTSAVLSQASRDVLNSSAQSHTPQSPRAAPGTSSPVHTVHSVAVIPPNTGGESIYRTIMNRLTVLEANTTLYTRYVEEQITGVREMMRRLGEDVGRLEGIGKAQAQMYQRSVIEFERHRKRLDLEHVELITKVNRLTDEVVLEKRLGIAQLCLLLAVLIFIALTRGSRGEIVHAPATVESQRSRTNSTHMQGKRTLSLSGLSADIMNRFRNPSKDPTLSSPVSDTTEGTQKPDADRVKFPSSATMNTDLPRIKRIHPMTNARKLAANVHVRSPASLRSPMRSAAHRYTFRPLTPTGPSSASLASAALLSPHPPLERAMSGGASGIVQSASMGSVIGPVPRSAKRWARSAHLHEVKSLASIPKVNGTSGSVTPVRPTVISPASPRQSVDVDESGSSDDVFSSEARTPLPWSLGARKESLTMHLARVSLSPTAVSPSRASRLPSTFMSPDKGDKGDMSEGDVWVDTDVDSSEAETGGAVSIKDENR